MREFPTTYVESIQTHILVIRKYVQLSTQIKNKKSGKKYFANNENGRRKKGTNVSNEMTLHVCYPSFAGINKYYSMYKNANYYQQL